VSLTQALSATMLLQSGFYDYRFVCQYGSGEFALDTKIDSADYPQPDEFEWGSEFGVLAYHFEVPQ